MAERQLEYLVHKDRFSKDQTLLAFLYFPFGIFLFLIRIFFGIIIWQASALLPELSPLRNFLVSLTSFTLGIVVKQSGQRDEKVRLLASNSVSIFDPFVLHSISGCISPSKLDLTPPLASALGIRNLCAQSNNELYKEAIKKKFADIPNVQIAVQPEECPTNGMALLKFSEWPFMLFDKIQPVAIKVNRYLSNVTNCNVQKIWTDIFWFLWNPYTEFTVQYLPCIEREDKESVDEFAKRCQAIIADYLKIEATQHTSQQIKELIASREAEKLRANSNIAQSPRNGSYNPRSDLMPMALQVKQVLPAVPLTVILKDLGKTRNVDVTLTNILDGLVSYTPESTEIASESQPSSSQVPVSMSPLQVAASSFSNTAQGRQNSYQERKAQLIAAARKRYIEKHGLSLNLL